MMMMMMMMMMGRRINRRKRRRVVRVIRNLITVWVFSLIVRLFIRSQKRRLVICIIAIEN